MNKKLQVQHIRELLGGLNMTKEAARKACFPYMNPSRFSMLMNEERRQQELDFLEDWLETEYIKRNAKEVGNAGC